MAGRKYVVFLGQIVPDCKYKKIAFQNLEPKLQKIISAVREAHATRHDGDPIEGIPQTSRYHTVGLFEGFQGGGGLSWVPMMPKDVSLSYGCTHDRCKISKQTWNV